MITVSKREAMKIMAETHLNRTLRIMKFDNGKYKWKGSCKHYIGLEVIDCNDVLAVFPERRQDSYGPYTQLRCVTL